MKALEEFTLLIKCLNQHLPTRKAARMVACNSVDERWYHVLSHCLRLLLSAQTEAYRSEHQPQDQGRWQWEDNASCGPPYFAIILRLYPVLQCLASDI